MKKEKPLTIKLTPKDAAHLVLLIDGLSCSAEERADYDWLQRVVTAIRAEQAKRGNK